MTRERLLCHMIKQGLKVLDYNFLSSLKFTNLGFCEDCSYSKHHEASFPSYTTESSDVLELTDSDT